MFSFISIYLIKYSLMIINFALVKLQQSLYVQQVDDIKFVFTYLKMKQTF